MDATVRSALKSRAQHKENLDKVVFVHALELTPVQHVEDWHLAEKVHFSSPLATYYEFPGSQSFFSGSTLGLCDSDESQEVLSNNTCNQDYFSCEIQSPFINQSPNNIGSMLQENAFDETVLLKLSHSSNTECMLVKSTEMSLMKTTNLIELDSEQKHNQNFDSTAGFTESEGSGDKKADLIKLEGVKVDFSDVSENCIIFECQCIVNNIILECCTMLGDEPLHATEGGMNDIINIATDVTSKVAECTSRKQTDQVPAIVTESPIYTAHCFIGNQKTAEETKYALNSSNGKEQLIEADVEKEITFKCNQQAERYGSNMHSNSLEPVQNVVTDIDLVNDFAVQHLASLSSSTCSNHQALTPGETDKALQQEESKTVPMCLEMHDNQKFIFRSGKKVDGEEQKKCKFSNKGHMVARNEKETECVNESQPVVLDVEKKEPKTQPSCFMDLEEVEWLKNDRKRRSDITLDEASSTKQIKLSSPQRLDILAKEVIMQDQKFQNQKCDETNSGFLEIVKLVENKSLFEIGSSANSQAVCDVDGNLAVGSADHYPKVPLDFVAHRLDSGTANISRDEHSKSNPAHGSLHSYLCNQEFKVQSDSGHANVSDDSTENSPRFISAFKYHSQYSQESSQGFSVCSDLDEDLKDSEHGSQMKYCGISLTEQTLGETDQTVPTAAEDGCILVSMYDVPVTEEDKTKQYACDVDICNNNGEPLCCTLEDVPKRDGLVSHENCFKWKYTPSCNVDDEGTNHSSMEEEPSIRISSLKTCDKPLRIGLSRRQNVAHLHRLQPKKLN